MDDFLQVILEETENVFKPTNQVNDEDGAKSGDTLQLEENINSTPNGSSKNRNASHKSSQKFCTKNAYLNLNGERIYNCKYCTEKFTCKSDQIHHLQHSHPSERPFHCLHCGKAFTTKNILKQHERIHTKERPYTCQYCCKTFSHRTALANHIRTHTGEKPYDCLYCEKSFGEKAKLLLHMRVHTGEKPFVCGHCQRAFRDKSSYNVHLRIHTGEKPFMCSYCQRCFTHRNSFKDHLRIHTGERPFVCIHCNRDFAKQSTLRKHLEVHGVVKPFELHVHAVIKPCSTTLIKNAAVNNSNNPDLVNTTKVIQTEKLRNESVPKNIASPSQKIVSEVPLPFLKFKQVLSPIRKMCLPEESKLRDASHFKQVHTCIYCFDIFDCKDKLNIHLQNHNEESKTWKTGLDMFYLFTTILGLDIACALGFHKRSPREILFDFLKAASVNTRFNNESIHPETNLHSLLKMFIGFIVNNNEQEMIGFDQICINSLLHEMISLLPLFQKAVIS